MELTLEQLKERVLEKYDADAIVDLLRITPEELLNAFQARFEYHRENFSSEEYFETDDELDEDS